MRKYILLMIPFIFSCKKENIVAKVGKRFIYERDIKDMQKIELAYGTYRSEEEALLLLIQKFIDLEIADMMGINLTEGDIAREEKRILNETKSPETLSKVYSSLSNRKRYREIYVKPILARRLIEKKFYFDSLNYQKEPYLEVKKKLKILKEKRSDTEDSLYFHFKPGDTVVTYQYLKSLISNRITSDKDTIEGIFEDKFGYYALQIMRKNKDFEIRGFHIQKKNFYDLYLKIIEKIQIFVYNKNIKSKILKKIRNTYWEGIIK